MEPEQRGRASRASSTSSLGREVRCGCQFYKSDSLLPERRALLFRPSSRTMQQPPAVRCSEHEYEPIAPPSHPAMAPVVRITDTDVMPVADSDDSIDDRGRLPPELILDGDVVLPLDGKIEDSAMEGRELGETGDTSEELDSPTAQEFQDRLEQRFLDASTPYTESRTDGEVNTSQHSRFQVDSSAIEELPLQRGARSLPQRLKTQAGKLRSRLQAIHRPKFAFAQKRQKPDKKKKTTTTTTTRSTATSSGKSDSRSRKSMEKRPSRIERLRSSISEKTGKFSLPLDRPRFSLPDKSKFHLPERPKFRLPDKSKFHLPDRPKFNIKKPNIRLPEAFSRVKRPSSTQEGQLSTESTAGSRRNIFDFATYPRIFDKKKRGDSHATSSPKDSRTESAESATFPRARKGKPRWTQRFDPTYDRPEETAAASDGSPPWHQTSLEEPPRLSARTEEEILAAAQAIPWEDTRKREYYDDEEIQYMDYEQESSERSDRRPAPPRRTHKARREESYEHEEATEVNPRLYGDQKRVHPDEVEEDEDATRTNWREEQQAMPEDKFRPIPRSRSLDEDMRAMEQENYGGAFMAVDPRLFGPRKAASEERRNEMELEEDEENEPSSMQSDREQQASSGSSCDRRRRGVIEEIDSDEFFLRASGISQDDVHLGEYLTDKIRDALRSEDINALDDIELPPTPPQRPRRMRSRRKYKETSVESNEVTPPVRPKRERAAARRSREASIVDEVFREGTRSDSRSDSRHRVVYQTEGDQQEPSQEPLDDIVVVKPARRKTRSSSLRSQSQPPMETSVLSPPTPDNVVPDALSATPPVVPIRRKRSHRETMMERRNGDVGAPIVCNGHHKWETETESKKPAIPTRPSRSRSRQSLIERLSGRDVMLTSQEDIRNLDAQLHRQDSGPEVVPVPPKRRSRSRTTSIAADEDRTSHGAESLPEAGYVEEDIPQEEETGSMQDLSNGYAMVDKREKPPPRRPPPRRRNKFATLPKPVPPKRPQRAYSTLRPVKKNIDMTSETISSTILAPADSEPYIEIDGDEHKDLRSGEVLNKMQGRPLPAPPRPPRIKKEHIERPRTPFEFAEITTATQTDPLPDDMVIEEEVTQAKLIVTPSRSGSQVLVSMERIPSPSRTSTPPVPPLPVSKFFRSEEQEEEEMREEEDIRMEYDTVSLTSPSPIRETDFDDKHKSAPHLQERIAEESQPRLQLRSGLLSDEPLRISSLEVGDLKVDRLSVSQIEAHKIVASEVDAMMITTSELRGGGSTEDSFSPAIIRELMAIRSHLETVTSQAQERQRERETASYKTTDIPTTENEQISEQQSEEQKSAESQLAPQKPTELQSEERQLAELQTAQQLLADLQLAQQLLAELQSAKQQSAELQFAQQPAEQQLEESQLTQQKSTESQPEEQQPAESQLTQQLPAELQPAQQLLADLQLAQQLLAELQSAPQQSAESRLAEQQSAEQQPPVEREATESSETAVNESAFTEDAKTEADEDQKVVKTDVIDVRAKKTSHTSSVAQAKETPSPQTLPIDDLEFKDTNESTTHLLSVAQDTQDKSLRILDSEHPLTLSSTSGSHVVESRASYPPSDVPSAQLSESRVSPERVAESPSSCVQTTATSTATTTEPDATSMDLHGNEDSAFDSKEQICCKSRSSSPTKSRSRSSSPKGIRQTASPVRSLPPAISVTPDTPDSTVSGRGVSMNAQPQRAVISYFSDTEQSVSKAAQPQRAVISHSFDLEQSLRDRQREFSQSPISSFPLNTTTHFIAIPASEIPASFFALNETPTSQHVDSEPGVIDTTQQLLRALRLTGIKAMRYFVRYLTSTISADDTREKVREVELAICALLLLIAGLLIYYFSRTQTVTHLHHWDYFNPPQ